MQRMSRTAGTPGAQGGGAAARPPHTPSGTRHACFRQTQVASTLRLAVTRALLDDPRDLVPRQLTRTARTAAWVALARPGRQDGTATAARDATPNVDVCLQARCARCFPTIAARPLLFCARRAPASRRRPRAAPSRGTLPRGRPPRAARAQRARCAARAPSPPPAAPRPGAPESPRRRPAPPLPRMGSRAGAPSRRAPRLFLTLTAAERSARSARFGTHRPAWRILYFRVWSRTGAHR